MLCTTGIVSFAETVEKKSIEASSMERLMNLGIFAKTDINNMNLDKQVSREELAVLLVQINGQQDKLDLYKNRSPYSDVSVTRWSNPYIQIAIKMGYMNAMPDGKFHPEDKINFSVIATVFGRLLKYDTDLSGTYQDYLQKMDDLGILDGINYSTYGSITRGQLAVMILRFITETVYGTDNAFVETISNYKWVVVLGNNITDSSQDERRIVTNVGTFYLKEGMETPELGKRYIFRIKDNEIQYAALDGLEYDELSIKSFVSGEITSNNGKEVFIPAGITFYYQGKETDYGTVSDSIQSNSSMIIGYKDSKAVYGALFDPLYSDAEIVTPYTAGTNLAIKYLNLTIEKGGKFINASQIEVNDVVYRITDIWGNFGYVLVYDNTIGGKITAILPSKISPTSIEMDGTIYELDASFPKQKLSNTSVIQVGETVTAIRSSEGRVIDLIYDTVSGTDAYALVLNAYTENSTKTSDFGTPYYYVTLLHSTGGKKTYLADKSMLSYRGKLATYEVIKDGEDYDTVKLKDLSNNISGSMAINKDERIIGNSYVANGVVIFNIINTQSAEIDAEVIPFGDLPSGTLQSGKVKYIHKSGDFDDIDVMLLDNANDENIYYGIVTSKKSSVSMINEEMSSNETLTILVNGQSMTYTTDETGLYYNSVARVKVVDNKIISVNAAISAAANGNKIEAVDLTRIKINGKVYYYSNKLSIYKLTGDNNWKKLEASDLSKDKDYGSVTIYLDKAVSNAGKVAMIIIR